MTLFLEVYPYVILTYGLTISAILTLIGCIIALDMLRVKPYFDLSQFIPALFWFTTCTLLAGAALALTKWVLTL